MIRVYKFLVGKVNATALSFLVGKVNAGGTKFLVGKVNAGGTRLETDSQQRRVREEW